MTDSDMMIFGSYTFEKKDCDDEYDGHDGDEDGFEYDDYEHENYSVMMMDDDNESNTSDDTEKNF